MQFINFFLSKKEEEKKNDNVVILMVVTKGLCRIIFGFGQDLLIKFVSASGASE